ncbi:hypothetical protein IT882_04415 [Microbacterium schleiferi]|uniref:Putative tail fiber protein gp53-like C-terminal domain-containing protein n=1 Tax=Microbacterium schleiferi TaxID=69362 RepID=A0A7S8MYM1_9MICO|nr:hypothetical protein [Microbacterium schleiferi]QPE05318.1 hypothetical protein IT882_04415 [Microbacterium schleiferi]
MAADGTAGARLQPQFLGSGAPATAEDLNIISDHVAKMGNIMVLSTADREAFESDGWEGLYCHDTDENLLYMHDGSAWKVEGVASLPPYNSSTVAFTGVPFIRGGIASGTTSGTGVLTHTFPAAFPTACAGVLIMPHQNSGYAAQNLPVLVQSSVSATGFQTLWASAAGVAVALPYIAFGY